MTPLVIVLLALLGVLFIGIVIGGYIFHWGWTGFASYPKERGDPQRRPVTFFVWLSVLIVPATVAIVGVGFAYSQQQVALDVQNKQAKSALEVQRAQAKNQALESYLDDIGILLVEQHLATQDPPNPISPESTLAKARTLAFLNIVGPHYKRVALDFLYQSNLITRQDVDVQAKQQASVLQVRLDQADLRQAVLHALYLANASLQNVFLNDAELVGSDLQGSDLSLCILDNADLSRANLSTLTMPSGYVLRSTLEGSSLKGAILEGTDLQGAILKGAILEDTNLQGADLRGAQDLTQEQIEQAEGDESTKLPENLRRPKSWSE
jgi:uncharacterized protein YjbI with pentapeptide repeats